MKMRTLIGMFRDKSGSTTITVILSLVLALALVASCLQWYWVNSTSTDIQTVADMGALAAAEVVAQSVMVMQTLDAFLLTMNLFGLLLHCVVVISGIVVVFGGPFASTAAVFCEKAIQFDREFCQRRQQIASDIEKFAKGLAAGTPVLAQARAAQVIAQNQHYLKEQNQSSYVGLAIPAPLTGTVVMSSDPAGLEDWQEDNRQAGQQNKESAEYIKELEVDIESAIDECFRLDIYKSPDTTRAFWDPSFALEDYRSEWVRVSKLSASAPDYPAPIDDTPSTRAQAAQRYTAYHQQLVLTTDELVRDAIGSTPAFDTPMKPQAVSWRLIADPQWSQVVLLLDHDEGERKAYHSKSDCFGLSNASYELHEVKLSLVRGDLDHPPCTWCGPPSWVALELFERDVEPFIAQWNLQAEALIEYERLREELAFEIDQVRKRTSSQFDQLVDMASEYLLGSRLTYEPAGGRGIWCVVINSSQRSLPDYTLAPLTGAQEVVLGEQIAVAGARLMPSSDESTLPSFIGQARMRQSTTQGIGGVVRSLFGDDEVVATTALGLWGSSLDLYASQVEGLTQFSQGLPWGLDVMLERAMEDIMQAAHIRVPDMRKPVATVVSSAQIGLPEIGGVEGALATFFNEGRNLLEETGGMSTYGMKEQIAAALGEQQQQMELWVSDMLTPTIAGVPFELDWIKNLTDGINAYVDKGFSTVTDAVYRLPDVTW